MAESGPDPRGVLRVGHGIGFFGISGDTAQKQSRDINLPLQTTNPNILYLAKRLQEIYNIFSDNRSGDSQEVTNSGYGLIKMFPGLTPMTDAQGSYIPPETSLALFGMYVGTIMPPPDGPFFYMIGNDIYGSNLSTLGSWNGTHAFLPFDELGPAFAIIEFNDHIYASFGTTIGFGIGDTSYPGAPKGVIRYIDNEWEDVSSQFATFPTVGDPTGQHSSGDSETMAVFQGALYVGIFLGDDPFNSLYVHKAEEDSTGVLTITDIPMTGVTTAFAGGNLTLLAFGNKLWSMTGRIFSSLDGTSWSGVITSGFGCATLDVYNESLWTVRVDDNTFSLWKYDGAAFSEIDSWTVSLSGVSPLFVLEGVISQEFDGSLFTAVRYSVIDLGLPGFPTILREINIYEYNEDSTGASLSFTVPDVIFGYTLGDFGVFEDTLYLGVSISNDISDTVAFQTWHYTRENGWELDISVRGVAFLRSESTYIVPDDIGIIATLEGDLSIDLFDTPFDAEVEYDSQEDSLFLPEMDISRILQLRNLATLQNWTVDNTHPEFFIFSSCDAPNKEFLRINGTVSPNLPHRFIVGPFTVTDSLGKTSTGNVAFFVKFPTTQTVYPAEIHCETSIAGWPGSGPNGPFDLNIQNVVDAFYYQLMDDPGYTGLFKFGKIYGVQPYLSGTFGPGGDPWFDALIADLQTVGVPSPLHGIVVSDNYSLSDVLINGNNPETVSDVTFTPTFYSGYGSYNMGVDISGSLLKLSGTDVTWTTTYTAVASNGYTTAATLFTVLLHFT